MKKQSKLSELRWPIGIILSIFGLIALSIWTIQQANIKPVVMDDYYFESYGDVDRNINEILKSQQAFDAKYNLIVDKKNFVVGTNDLTIKISSKENGAPVLDANITVKITKPDTNKYDKMLKVVKAENGNYQLENFTVEKIGRWQILTKATVNDATSFTKTEVNATK